jgi:hypothetical protein
MAVIVERLGSSLRTLLGDFAGDRAAATPPLPAGLAPELSAIVADGEAMLMRYQGVGYVRLYLRRIRRFIDRPGVDRALLETIVSLAAARMAYPDPMRLAQLALEPAAIARGERADCIFLLADLIALLPGGLAEPLDELARAVGLARLRVRLRFDGRSAWRRPGLRITAGLRRWRGLGPAAQQERRAVERWLHMIDRALTLQPDAAPAIARSVAIIDGSGEHYRERLSAWHAIIDGLAKPAFDGTLWLPDLGHAIEAACQEAGLGSEPTHAAIARLREAAQRG